MGGGSTPVPQPTPAPPSGEPRSSQGGPGKTKSPGPLGPPTPRIKFLGRELELSWKPGSQGERAVTLRLHSVPPPTQQLRMARKGGGGESRGRRVAVGKAAGPLRSLPAPPHQLSRQGSCGVNPFPSTDGGDGPGGPHPSHRPPPAPGRWNWASVNYNANNADKYILLLLGNYQQSSP
ncbi:collagen alpha-1(I) chain-like isoform X2 [Panthera tigris]|uniref:collagen alpha-1(I) chain-like isoform X2 n=1 Tax=Panthera tigris TaxID=9694 RepID=UPI001C6F6ABF|nr:collagen alpha-1(I) chain-like isoform X2 [Panthera tigris]